MARLIQLQPVNLAVMADGANVVATNKIHWERERREAQYENVLSSQEVNCRAELPEALLQRRHSVCGQAKDGEGLFRVVQGGHNSEQGDDTEKGTCKLHIRISPLTASCVRQGLISQGWKPIHLLRHLNQYQTEH